MSDLLVSPEEQVALFCLHDDLHLGILKMANILQLPHHLTEWLIQERERERRMEQKWAEELEQQEQVEEILAEVGLDPPSGRV